MNRFPQVDSREFVDYAIEAFDEAVANPKLDIDMKKYIWFSEEQPCRVCLAGAAFVKAYGLPDLLKNPKDVNELLASTGHYYSQEEIDDICRTVDAFDDLRQDAGISVGLEDPEEEDIKHVRARLKKYKVRKYGTLLEKFWLWLKEG